MENAFPVAYKIIVAHTFEVMVRVGMGNIVAGRDMGRF